MHCFVSVLNSAHFGALGAIFCHVPKGFLKNRGTARSSGTFIVSKIWFADAKKLCSLSWGEINLNSNAYSPVSGDTGKNNIKLQDCRCLIGFPTDCTQTALFQ